ncbi:pyridoxamine 5'-phosphate oxidase family protein [Saliphagus infecundisoli]|uniref:Pyridoxamine 5'-phosphate oxidase family protein n=1 Tax=Saliphagus infecundisoli TaxID=1849069 RepID=A0ABD5QLF2_9EURY|nr:pyridoxamine 5'-phosphate oxidase family protein [Saliphagus infecundisoli]
MSNWNRMNKEEISEFLGRGGTGVISFATESDEPPVTIPVSYGYNADIEALYFQLSIPQESRKAELVPRQVSFVVHDETDGGWQSVVATGQLEEISDSPYESTAIQGMWAIEIPIVEIFDRPRTEVTFRYFLLEPETLTGRTEVPSQ